MPLDPHPPGVDPEPEAEPRPREPVYARGPALKVEPDAVELVFLDLEETPLITAEADDGDPETPGLEIKTPLGVRIPVFEGPLDLLLYLIRRDKLDIYDIPIGIITEQYLSMLGLMRVLDLEVAGDFLVMAATLMRVKARMLLPTWPDDEEEEEDPRADLVRQLLEYRQFKEAALQLRQREEERRLLFARGFIPDAEEEVPVELAPLSHFALIEVMQDVLSRVGEGFFYEVELEDVTIEEKMELVRAELEQKGRVLFVDLISRTPRRMHVVVTFVAILEMARTGDVALAQEAAFGQIWIYPVKEGRVVNPDPDEPRPAPSPVKSPIPDEGDVHGTT